MTEYLATSVLFRCLAKWCLVASVLAMAASCSPTDTTPPATTGSVPTDRPEEDEPGWICTAADDSCDETSY